MIANWLVVVDGWIVGWLAGWLACKKQSLRIFLLCLDKLARAKNEITCFLTRRPCFETATLAGTEPSA